MTQTPLIPHPGLLFVPYPSFHLVRHVFKVFIIPLCKPLVQLFSFLERIMQEHDTIKKRAPQERPKKPVALFASVDPVA